MTFQGPAESLRRRLLGRGFWLYLWRQLPLAAFAGLRLERLDEVECRVRLPGGWRTRNPFGSAYFAAQCMAAELSTGAPALALAAGAPASVALIVVELRARFVKRVVGPSHYVFRDLPGMREAVERAAASDEPVTFAARVTAHAGGDEPVSEFEVGWSFKRRARPAA